MAQQGMGFLAGGVATQLVAAGTVLAHGDDGKTGYPDQANPRSGSPAGSPISSRPISSRPDAAAPASGTTSWCPGALAGPAR